MPDRLASLAMYISPPPIAEATAVLWRFLSEALVRAGLPDVPSVLDEAVRYDEAWLRPELLLAQTCGYPYVKYLRGRVRLVATPIYDLAGCDGPHKCSFIIVAKDSAVETIEDLRGARAAINEPDSNSGVNLFRASIAPYARDGRFFSSVIETGGHRASIDAVTSGAADTAAIDCVSYGNTLRFDPERLSGVRILAETVKGPGLPLITRADACDDEVAVLRSALDEAIAAPELAQVRETLSLKGFVPLDDAAYEVLAELDRAAHRLGYPAIA